MIVFPNAKINLGLQVLRKRPDGFHDLSSVFFPVPLCDILEVTGAKDVPENISDSQLIKPEKIRLPSGKLLYFSFSGLTVDGNIQQNLCVKACMLYDQEVHVNRDIRMHLHKIIPTGAGLGGGSSDATAVLQVLNKLHDKKLSDQQLMTLAAQLGSDCPFFLINKPAIAEGRGERLKTIELDLSAYTIVIVKPEFGVKTAEAFSGITPEEKHQSLEQLIKLPVNTWQESIYNDFEDHIFEKHPQLRSIKNKLSESGAVYTSMSGSGSAVYGIYNSTIPAPDDFPGCFYFAGTL